MFRMFQKKKSQEPLFIYRIEAVSYTQLDVYKRQIRPSLRTWKWIASRKNTAYTSSNGLSCHSFTIGSILSVIRLIVLSEMSISYSSRIAAFCGVSFFLAIIKPPNCVTLIDISLEVYIIFGIVSLFWR